MRSGLASLWSAIARKPVPRTTSLTRVGSCRGRFSQELDPLQYARGHQSQRSRAHRIGPYAAHLGAEIRCDGSTQEAHQRSAEVNQLVMGRPLTVGAKALIANKGRAAARTHDLFY